MAAEIPALRASPAPTAEWEGLCHRLVACRACPRLVEWRERGAGQPREWGRPVPGEGDLKARVLVIGLAPGLRGAHRTGRPFYGDASGRWLRSALARQGWAGADGETLRGVFVTNVVRCAPPANRVTRAEAARCQPYLEWELSALEQVEVVVTLGREAFAAYVRMRPPAAGRPKFEHGAIWVYPDRPHWLCASYHPSLHNTGPGRLTRMMWESFWRRVAELAATD